MSPGDSITIADLTFQTIIGVYPEERLHRQNISLDIKLYLDLDAAANQCDLAQTIDYAQLADEIKFIVTQGKFVLLETAADCLARYLLAPLDNYRVTPKKVEIKIKKTSAISGAAYAAIKLARGVCDYTYPIENSKFGKVNILAEYHEMGLYLLRIAPGQQIPWHYHQNMEESEMILTEGLLLQEMPVAVGLKHHWPKNYPRNYRNPSSIEQLILCIDRPKFDPVDEIAIETASGQKVAPPHLYRIEC